MITIADLIAYRRRHEKLVERVVSTKLPTGVRRVHRGRLPLAGRQQAPRRAGQGRRRRDGGRARPRALRVPDRRRVPLAALRLRRAARVGAVDDRARGPRRAALPEPGGARDRAAQQAAGLQAPGGGPRHGRRQPRARPPGRPARLRDRRPDPRRPRADQHPDPHQQPQEDLRAGRLRAVGDRPDPDPARAQSPQRGLPAGQARPARPHPASPGARARRGDAPRRAGGRPAPARVAAGDERAAPAGASRCAWRASTRSWPRSSRPARAPRWTRRADRHRPLRRARRVRAAAGRQVRGAVGPLRRAWCVWAR